MIQVNHFNDVKPNRGDAVLAVSRDGDSKFVELVDFDEDTLDPDDFTFKEAVWFSNYYDEYYDISEYPYWTKLEFDYINKSKIDQVIESKTTEGFSIPGYKIVGGCVVKA